MEIKTFSCLLLGNQSLLIQCGKHLLERNHSIVGVISADPSCVRWAENNHIPTFTSNDAFKESSNNGEYDYLFSLANLSITEEWLIDQPRDMAINFHDGILPDHAGLNVPAWSLLNNETEHGITFHEMLSKVDQGDILVQERFPIDENETSFTLNAKCFEHGVQAFQSLIKAIEEDRLERQSQDLSVQKYFAGTKKPELGGIVDFTKPLAEVSNFLRALDFGPYANPLTTPKLIHNNQCFVIKSFEEAAPTGGPAGTIAKVDGESLIINCADGSLEISSLTDLLGNTPKPLPFREGEKLGFIPTDEQEGYSDLIKATALFEKSWQRSLASIGELETPYISAKTDAGTDQQTIEIKLSDIHQSTNGVFAELDQLLAASMLFFARLSNKKEVHLPWQASNDQINSDIARTTFAGTVPFYTVWQKEDSFSDFYSTWQQQCETVKKRISYAKDLPLRAPELAQLGHTWREDKHNILFSCAGSNNIGPIQAPFIVACNEADSSLQWRITGGCVDSYGPERLQEQFTTFLEELANGRAISKASILSPTDKEHLLQQWNPQPNDLDSLNSSLPALFDQQVAATPDAVAVCYRNKQLTYAELQSKSNQLARSLIQKGIQSGDLVGIHVQRSDAMMVALFAVLKAGAAYVPLDPNYPAERLQYMVEDSKAKLVISGDDSPILQVETPILKLDLADADLLSQPTTAPEVSIASSDLAYVIYTSGSTGKPKGVMVEHRNVINFFHGMDQNIDHEPGDVWLAVTSISFDISVLELFWSLCRGLKVVVHSDQSKQTAQTKRPDQKIGFSLFFWNYVNEADKDIKDPYRLLMEAAEFADQNDFEAIWTPERHFGSFGGIYPNPSVISAAIAARTNNVKIRAGSCVLPLHSPIRVAEDWSIVDNLSNGRVGISFAAGWQPNDFVIKPENHADAKNVMMRDIEVVRKLWRGEAVNFDGPNGEVPIQTLPRPVQKEVPVWVTSAGNPDTFIKAGELGAYLLTHLLGQSIEQVGENIALYRKAWKEAGHPGEGHVTLMLHTLIGSDDNQVEALAREPMKNYLKSAMFLVKDAAWQFPTFKKMSEETGASLDDFFKTMSDEDLDGLLDFAFERYYQQSGLFGTLQRCVDRVDQIKAIGVDEIGCLIDYGLKIDDVLSHLPLLSQVQKACNPEVSANEEEDAFDYSSIPALLNHHKVTHLQCTPSQAKMLTLDQDAHAGIKNLKQFMVGGEACPPELAQELLQRLNGKLTNMYGPTETTIWSATHQISAEHTIPPIGRPIKNTHIYIVDDELQPMPAGIPGELVIAGEGVVRGYLNRESLTAERFVDNPFNEQARFENTKLYHTGDRAVLGRDDYLHYLGRMDFQVKIRGYRIELGEIEAALTKLSQISSAVAVVREDQPGNQQLVAYVIQQSQGELDANEIKETLNQTLPEFMVPSFVVSLTNFPLTPNGKVDRKQLPSPNESEKQSTGGQYAAPEDSVESSIAEIWSALLGQEQVSINDNFFAIGGHSLLAVEVLNQLRQRFSKPIQMTDLFRYTTIKTLAKFMTQGNEQTHLNTSQARADARKASKGRRRRR